MVHEQGDIVDSIESNIEAATVQVHEGADQLRQVSQHRDGRLDRWIKVPFNSVTGVNLHLW